MKKRLLIYIFTIISIFIIGINNYSCITITPDNHNTDVQGGGGSGGTNITNGIGGAEMEGIKVAVYRANKTMVPGTTPQYIIVKDGSYYAKNFCSCGNKYDFSTWKDNSGCSCSKNATVSYKKIDGLSETSLIWGLYFSKPSVISAKINNITILDKILVLVGYKNSDGTYKYEDGDYLIVEPLVTVSCQSYSSSIYVTGTINSMLENNFSYFGGTVCGTWTQTTKTTKKVWVPPSGCTLKCVGGYDRYGCHKYEQVCTRDGYYKEETVETSEEKPQDSMFRWYYAAIAQSFKVRSSSCSNSSVGTGHGLNDISRENYSGCGYNRYNLADLLDPPPPPPHYTCEKNDGKWYDINGNETTEAGYKDSCGCQKRDNKWFDANANIVSSEFEMNLSCGACASQAQTTNPVERIRLYNYYSGKNQIYKNLLNFSKVGADACTTDTNSKYEHNKECLRVTKTNESTFTETNMSKYMFTREVNAKPMYCNANLSIEPYNVQVPHLGTSQPGMAYLGGTSTQSKIADATLTVTCYLYNAVKNTDNKPPFSTDNAAEFNSYVANVVLGDKALVGGTVTAINNDSYNETKKLYKFERIYKRGYSLPARYIDKISGKLLDSQTSSSVTRYGYYSLLNEKVTNKTVSFSITKGANATDMVINNNGNCNYSTSGRTFNGKLLEFRTIDTENPFLGSSGKGRKVGANWCEPISGNKYNCSSSNNIVTGYIKNSNNSYNKYQMTPIYTIKLDNNALNKITAYNKTHKIDTYDIVCKNNVCTNQFFKQISSSITRGSNRLIRN